MVDQGWRTQGATEAVQALGCERCKQCVLPVDMMGLVVDFALHDPEERVWDAAVLARLANDPSLSAQLRAAAWRKLR
ncbi:MAG: hypothetical protein R3E79_21135 [Caldilineaceae bacterium]